MASRRERQRLSLVGHAAESPAAVRVNPARERGASEFGSLRGKLREDIRITIFMLDLAVNQAGRIAAATGDPELKNKFDDCLRSVAELLELARQRAIGL